MIYRSNLSAPDLTPYFKHLVSRPMPHSFGHDVPSDWGDKADDDPVFGLYKKCGMWTHDEAAILYNVAKRRSGWWGDIGAHTGWTTAHIAAARCLAIGVDPLYGEWIPNQSNPFVRRALDNEMELFGGHKITPYSLLGATSAVWFENLHIGPPEYKIFEGFCIDGDHEPGKPLEDAQNSAKHLTETGVILFHDFIGRPVREAVEWLMNNGFQARVYMTPHMVACCWRGDFTPPDHTPDPNLPDLKARCPEFPFERCV